jgi:hypothetical protein
VTRSPTVTWVPTGTNNATPPSTTPVDWSPNSNARPQSHPRHSRLTSRTPTPGTTPRPPRHVPTHRPGHHLSPDTGAHGHPLSLAHNRLEDRRQISLSAICAIRSGGRESPTRAVPALLGSHYLPDRQRSECAVLEVSWSPWRATRYPSRRPTPRRPRYTERRAHRRPPAPPNVQRRRHHRLERDRPRERHDVIPRRGVRGVSMRLHLVSGRQMGRCCRRHAGRTRRRA